MIRIKNAAKMAVFLIVITLIGMGLLHFSLIDVCKIQSEGNAFHYNMISFSAIVGGFLFTGISILISALGNERIKRLWNNNYLDNIYWGAFIGIGCNVLTIACAFILLAGKLSQEIAYDTICLEFLFWIISMALFVWCVRFLFSIISRLKNIDDVK